MKIKELTIFEFEKFAKNFKYNTYCQNINYAMLLADMGFDYEFVGLILEEEILAAAMIVTKEVNKVKYGYSPKGFLIDFNNRDLLKSFTSLVKEHYFEKEVAFIKINPEYIVGKYDYTLNKIVYDSNSELKDYIQTLDYKKLKDNLYFESMFPRFTARVDLTKLDIKNFQKNTRNKVRKSITKGLVLELVDKTHLDILDKHTLKDSFFYHDLYNTFKKSDNADLFIVKIDADLYLELSQEKYLEQSEVNRVLSSKMIRASHKKNINNKMNSDLTMLSYKKSIMEASKFVENNEEYIIGAALVIKNDDTVKLITSGYNKEYKRFLANYFMHYKLMEYYKDTHKIFDFNKMSGDFTKDNPYKGLSDFILGFNPDVYEYIGEFDLIIEPNAYNYLLGAKVLNKEFSIKF